MGCELGGARFELALARLERLRTLERGTLASHDRVGAARRVLPGLGRLSAAEPSLELCKLAFARGNRLGAFAERLLQPLQLGACIRLAGVPLRRKLPGESKELRPVEVRVGFVGCVAATPRRPRVEALFPAVYVGSFRPASTATWCPFSIIRCSSPREDARRALAQAGSAESRRRAGTHLRRRGRRRGRVHTGARSQGRDRSRRPTHGNARCG
jgi:hypothetical protein